MKLWGPPLAESRTGSFFSELQSQGCHSGALQFQGPKRPHKRNDPTARDLWYSPPYWALEPEREFMMGPSVLILDSQSYPRRVVRHLTLSIMVGNIWSRWSMTHEPRTRGILHRPKYLLAFEQREAQSTTLVKTFLGAS